MIRRLWMAVLAALLVIAGTSTPAVAVPAGTDRPFGATAAGAAIFDLSNPRGCAYPDPYYRITTCIAATGQASHLGAFRINGSHCPTPTQSTLGQITLTAANGDQLTGTYLADTVIDPGFTHVDVSGWITVTGGTGRFREASGSLEMDAVITITDPTALSWPGQFTLAGEITY